jgi:MSHA type pilus biogenesis protein MshL
MASNQGGEFDEDSIYGSILKSVDSIISEEDQFGEGEGGGDEGEEETKGYFAIDPLSGRLYVRTTPGKLRAVAKMLNNLRAKLSRQVVIDARLLEVSLEDDYELGIDWNYVANRMMSDSPFTVTWLGRTDVAARGRTENQILKIDGEFGDDTLDTAIEAIQTFGGVKTLANPHVRTKHGQPALFTSGTSSRFVSGLTRETDDQGNVLFTTETATVFSGVMLGVSAYINDNNVIDLQIFPIQSTATNLGLQQVTTAGDQISLPVVDVKSVSSTVRVKDGDTIILGGMISKDSEKTDEQVPGLGNVPGLGWLFKNRDIEDEVKEMVIIMTIRVIQ